MNSARGVKSASRQKIKTWWRCIFVLPAQVQEVAQENPCHYDESASGRLYYYRARYYSPELSRFISEDPLGFGGGDVNLAAYVRGNPVSNTDPSGEFVPLVTGAIGAAAGFVGNIAGQLYQNGGNWNCIKWKNAGIAAGVGFVAGALAPFVATSIAGAAGLGAASNLAGYGITQAANGDPYSWAGAGWSVASGAVGGAAGGAFRPATPFATNSPFLNQGVANSLNQQATLAQNVTAGNLARNFGGAAVSGTDWPPVPGASSGQCGCK